MSEELKPLVNKKVVVRNSEFNEYGSTTYAGTLKSFNVTDKSLTLENVILSEAHTSKREERDRVVLNWNWGFGVEEVKENSGNE